MATLVYVGLGSNLALPQRQVGRALHRLAHWPGVRGLRASRLYRTPPWGQREQPDFINAAVEFEYAGSAGALLAGLLAIEREAGRIRGGERWGPRMLDLDLLLFGDCRLRTGELTLPHPRIAERAFVLFPLLELAPSLVMPDGQAVADLAAAVDAAGVAALD